MCGIIGYIGPRDVVPILLDGLEKLEYRGYDSAGIAVCQQSLIGLRRTEGKLARLRELVARQPITGQIGIGHTRWATHGRPSETNAHPHVAGDVAVVHNGIIENYVELKHELERAGRVFRSETDTEIVAQLIDHHIQAGLEFEPAVRAALKRIVGSFALAILDRRNPSQLVAGRKDGPLIVGYGEGEFFVASDVSALLEYTRHVTYLEDNELAFLTRNSVRFTDLDGNLVEKKTTRVAWDPVMAQKAGYKHFMHKEIKEQPSAIIETFRGRVSQERHEIILPGLPFTPEEIQGLKKMFIVACGTSYHASLVGKFLIEKLVRLPVEVDLASEFRYRDPILDKSVLEVLISQSGETADTLAAMREGLAKGARTMGICNVVDSSIARGVEGVVYTQAGPEIGVASTKAFTTQLVCLYLLALYLGRRRGVLDESLAAVLVQDLFKLPHLVEKALEQEEKIIETARELSEYSNCLYLGRGINYPLALEGALKLKEISYIHAEGYPAGEMKHGPIALIDPQTPVIVCAPKTETLDKICSNIDQVRARGGKVIAVTEEDNELVKSKADFYIPVPDSPPLLMPVVLAIPLQLLAYHIAVLRGTDVDQPRNLAKSVTVE